ncbi:response regulator [Rhizobium sp. 2MFCol3.1]|jgi:DNA-binding NtrC family response regulator|uniref:response regulator n=1 Tax=Rhizobium sp. 2MFCol3.1 TaxID=1246459 RepID=UPI00037F3612|nr:response regulator [Rhizobium sp. 2MFCol3.1]
MTMPARIVIVVEDEPLIRLFIADALEGAGFAVLEAGSVLEAVGVLGMRTDVDAIFTDVDMPGGLSGIDLANMVASVSPHMGVVVTSGRADVNPSDLPAGAKFLPKPYNATVAIATVESVIQRRRGSEEAVAS